MSRDAGLLRRELLRMKNGQLCDVAWRAGLPWEAPLRFARGEVQLDAHQLDALWLACCDPEFSVHGENERPLSASDFWERKWQKIIANTK